jgi:GDPmannose 4,6-dehydratase
MWRILQAPAPDDWLLATGHAITVREFAERVFRKVGFSLSWTGSGIDEIGIDQHGITRVKVDPRYYRPTEVPFLLGDSTKARTLLGWEPKYSLEDLINEMVEYAVNS